MSWTKTGDDFKLSVDIDGTPTEIVRIKGTGNSELDDAHLVLLNQQEGE